MSAFLIEAVGPSAASILQTKPSDILSVMDMMQSSTRFRPTLKAFEEERRKVIGKVYRQRRNRLGHPEGRFDKVGRWYPSDREDAGDVTSKVRSPSRAWPYSYMLRARTRQHCAHLVAECLRGHDVPADVAEACEELRAVFYRLILDDERGKV